VLGCLLDNNRSTIPISGIFGSYKDSRVRGTLLLTGNSSCDGVVITNNFVEGAYDWEGGVGLWMDSGTARNCIIADNFMRVCDARDGAYAGAVHVGGGVFENNAVYRNVVRGTQSELIAAVRVTGSGKVRNSLIADNGLHGTNNWSGPVAAFSNCCTTAAGELDDCIPAVEGVYAVADGLPRLPNASPLAARSIGPALPDGAAEFVCPFTVTRAHALDALETTLTARPVGDTAGLICTWTLEGDGTLTPAADGLTAAFSLTTPGTAQVTLTAENAAGGSFTSTQTLGVSPSKLYVVKDNADAAAPYATWATAAPDIATAVAAAEDGAEVIVSNGTYVLSAYVPILKDVHVRGVSANRDDVILDCNNGCQAFVLASEGAMVSNMRLYRFAKGAWYVANSAGITLFGCGTVTNCHFDGANTTYTSAKALRNRCGIVRDCTFERCVGYDSYADPDWTGNGVLIQYGKIALTERCIFTNNAVNPAGGTAWGQLYVHDGIVRNCHIADNSITATATFSGPSLATGVRIRGGLIENCTIVRNRAIGPIQPFVAGLVQVGGTVRNCLMVDNASASAVDEPVDWLASTPASLINCAAASVDGTESGVAVTASAYVWKDGVLRLTPLSPAINAGVTADWMAGATDLLGKPRVMGSSVDIGAIEFDPNALAVDFSCDTYEAIDEYNATLTAIINGDTTGLAVVWDLDGDGIYETSGVSVEFRLDKPGQTTVSVKATNNGGEEATCSHIFTVYPHTLYVVSQNPAAAAPYTNWTTAAATIGDAIALAGNGSAIIVSNGTYAINSQILLTRAINLRGLTGDFDDVIVDAQNNCRALKVATAGASVSGITFKRGMEGSVSGAYVYGGSATAVSRRIMCATLAVFPITGRLQHSHVTKAQ
jgi:PKD repeat protein